LVILATILYILALILNETALASVSYKLIPDAGSGIAVPVFFGYN